MDKVSIKQRDVVLVPFPFSDFSDKKIRPVVVISNDEFNKSSDDVIVCGITSNILKDFYSIEILKLDEGNLFNPCCIKVENILKISKNLLIKKIGKLKDKDFSKILEKLDTLFRE